MARSLALSDSYSVMVFTLNNMWVVTYRKVWYILSVVLIAASLYAVYHYGWKPSIDFTGGAITEVSYTARPEKEVVEENIKKLNLGGFSVRPSGEKNFIIRSRELDNAERAAFLKALTIGSATPKVE